MGLLHHQNLGIGRVSRASRVMVWIKVSVRLRLRFSFSGAKIYKTRQSGRWVKLSVLPVKWTSFVL